jgi:hypothetical protein
MEKNRKEVNKSEAVNIAKHTNVVHLRCLIARLFRDCARFAGHSFERKKKIFFRLFLFFFFFFFFFCFRHDTSPALSLNAAAQDALWSMHQVL